MKKMISVIIFFITIFSTIGSIPTSANIEDYTIKTNDKYDMIIIAPSSYSSSLVNFIEHKNNLGISTIIVTLNDIYSGKYFEVQGRDDQEKIKYFIKDSMENWDITYVLFVGSSIDIPVRYCYNDDMYGYEDRFVSELYYADIYEDNYNFSSWDSDGDGIFGEWRGNKAEDKPIDLKPDVYLGRLACLNTNEVETVVNKIINYEKQLADDSWFKRMVVVGGDTYDEFEVYEGEYNTQRAIDEMPGFIAIKLWASTGSLSKFGLSMIRAINKGCGFLYLSGHGSKHFWITRSPSGSYVGRFGRFHMLLIFNRNKLPICLVGGCHNSNFDIDTYNHKKNLLLPWSLQTWRLGCWSWFLVSNQRGGSIATIGSTGLCWDGIEYGGGGSDWLNTNFFKEYNNGTKKLGQLWKDTISAFIETFPIDWETPAGNVSSIDAKSVQEWVLLGDPSLIIGGYQSFY
jgi:hypothetical protein